MNSTDNGYRNKNNVINVRYLEQGEDGIYASVKAKIESLGIASKGKESEFICE